MAALAAGGLLAPVAVARAQGGDPTATDSAPPAGLKLGDFRLLSRVPAADLTAALERQWQGTTLATGPAPAGRWLQANALGAVYRARGFRPLFLGDEFTHRLAENLLTQIDLASSHALNPARYRLGELSATLGRLPAVVEKKQWWEQLLGEKPPVPGQADSLALVDALLADRYLQFGYDLRFGELDGPPRPAPKAEPRPAGKTAAPESTLAAAPPAPPALADTLILRLSSGNPPPVAAWAPTHPQYAQLRQALDDYRRVVKAGGWPAVDAVSATIKPGATDRRVAQVRARLDAELAALTGQPAPAPPLHPDHFDTTLAARIRVFQRHHQLEPDGTLGKLTAQEMGVTAEKRLRQIEINLTRWRIGPPQEPETRVEVNTPAMTLNFWKEGRMVLTSRTVVGSGKQSAAWLGKTAHAQTPELYDEIETIEINPYWYIPEIIIRTELLRKEKSKPGFLDRGGYEWYNPSTGKSGGNASEIPEEDWSNPRKRLWLRQKQGAGNSLGRIKFIFHNAYGVYLHDTPDKQYFKRVRRNFSHGCVRLQNPAVLAESLLTMTTARRPTKPVADLMKGSAHQTFHMTPPMPIHLLYRTVWMESDGTVDFLPDIYGWDDELAARIWPEQMPLARGADARDDGSSRVREAPTAPPSRGN